MVRNHRSAKKAGTDMEVHVVSHLKLGLWRRPFGEYIERRTKTGAKDRGDIAGVRLPNGGRLVIEVKNTSQPKLGPWLNEAETERVNDEAAACCVIYKRVGFGWTRMGKQSVLMTLDDLIVILGGERPTMGQEEE